MCVTTLSAQLTETRIGVWDIMHPQHGYRHVLVYQNAVLNQSDEANCMLLHVPSKQALRPEHIIDSANDVSLLIDMEQSIFPVSRASFAANHVVQMGVYHIALLNDVSENALDATLEKIPVEKRPNIPAEYLEFYALLFPGFPLVLCCFSNQDRMEASPIMIHFDPIYPDYFMFNTLDGHGGLPDLDEHIKFHQTIITGSHRLTEEKFGFKAFNHSGASEYLLPWLPKYGTAFKMKSTALNRDLVLSTQAFETEEKVGMELGWVGTIGGGIG